MSAELSGENRPHELEQKLQSERRREAQEARDVSTDLGQLLGTIDVLARDSGATSWNRELTGLFRGESVTVQGEPVAIPDSGYSAKVRFESSRQISGGEAFNLLTLTIHLSLEIPAELSEKLKDLSGTPSEESATGGEVLYQTIVVKGSQSGDGSYHSAELDPVSTSHKTSPSGPTFTNSAFVPTLEGSQIRMIVEQIVDEIQSSQ